VALLLGPCAVTTVAAQPRPDLAGRWVRNVDQSQSFKDKMAMVADPLGGHRDQPERRYFYAWLKGVFAQIDHLEIELSGNEAKIIFGDDMVRIFYLDRKHMRQSPEGVKIQAASHWVDGDLVVEQAGEQGTKTTERFSLLEGGNQLAHLLRLEDKRLSEPLQIRTVFDRVPAGE